jgi:hypothetical protein
MVSVQNFKFHSCEPEKGRREIGKRKTSPLPDAVGVGGWRLVEEKREEGGGKVCGLWSLVYSGHAKEGARKWVYKGKSTC